MSSNCMQMIQAAIEQRQVRLVFVTRGRRRANGTKKRKIDQEPGEHIPGFRVSNDEILRLLRDVGVPIEHVLAEADVGPENGEGEEPFPHDVVMLDRHDAFQITGPLQSAAVTRTSSAIELPAVPAKM